MGGHNMWSEDMLIITTNPPMYIYIYIYIYIYMCVYMYVCMWVYYIFCTI